MAVVTSKTWDIYEGLKERFLFKNDFNSIYILLTLYDLEENISNIYPKYFSTKTINRKIKRILSNKNNGKSIAHNIAIIVNEDVNRLELCFYLEGYKYGYCNNRWVNILEEKALGIYGVNGIYKNKNLFHFDVSNRDIKKIKTKFIKEIDNKENREKNIEDLVYTFANKVIKKKIYNIDNYIHKQLKLNFDLYDFSIEEEKYNLRDEEADKIYHCIVNTLIKNLKQIFKEAAWYALNDKVIKRYY